MPYIPINGTELCYEDTGGSSSFFCYNSENFRFCLFGALHEEPPFLPSGCFFGVLDPDGRGFYRPPCDRGD